MHSDLKTKNVLLTADMVGKVRYSMRTAQMPFLLLRCPSHAAHAWADLLHVYMPALVC